MNRPVLVLFITIFLNPLSVLSQNLTGVITTESFEPVKDAHIQIVGSSQAAISSDEGRFTLPLSKEYIQKNLKLIISSVGYEDKIISINVKEFLNKEINVLLSEAVYESEMVVVTATRTRKDVEEVSIPVSVVRGEEIERSGSMRLSEVLSEQTGMQIVNDHGTGIQVQGFDPDYTLIMIDGNPIIGRTAGTLDLTRISVKNVEQIEIVKGPSSALWGSDALAGVVNIITQQNTDPFDASFNTRYGENNTFDISGDVSLNLRKWNNDFFVNRNSSSGYKLNQNSVSQTVPEFLNYTLNYQSDIELNENFSLSGSLRYFTETQDNLRSLESGSEGRQILVSNEIRRDFIAQSGLIYKPNSKLELDFNWLSSFYKNGSELRFQNTGQLNSKSEFDQYYNRPELKANYRWNITQESVIGTGAIFERLVSQRYPGEPEFHSEFIFLQHSWTPSPKFELTGGFRYDTHSEYASQWSPKLSTRFEATNRIKFRASVGRGYKAPAFRQLFLSFTNPTAGYSVFGHSELKEGLQRLEDEGNIDQILIPVNSVNEIRSESSWSLNTGIDLNVNPSITIRTNFFRNNVDDLIEAAPVARKTNGQSVFTYFNLDEVYTQGVEAELRLKSSNNFSGSVGYQFLDARRKIERELTLQNEQGELIQQTEISFKPMFNRSRHSGNVKLFYENDKGWGANIRGILRGSYGLFDENGNGFADDGEEEPGYMVWNIASSKTITSQITLQLGVDNVLDYTDINQPYLSGRLLYGQVSITL